MEILIVGLAVVALMVYVSTKIKKSAAEAYDAETVETEDFIIYKPDGFIHPLNGDLPFEANSKEWGKNEASKFRQARAALRVVSNSDFKTVCENAKKTTGKIISKNFAEDAPAGQKIFTLKGESVENTVKTLVFWKIVEDGREIYELRAAVIEAYSDEFTEKIKTMLASFSVK